MRELRPGLLRVAVMQGDDDEGDAESEDDEGDDSGRNVVLQDERGRVQRLGEMHDGRRDRGHGERDLSGKR
jgi:hypothetical protein